MFFYLSRNNQRIYCYRYDFLFNVRNLAFFKVHLKKFVPENTDLHKEFLHHPHTTHMQSTVNKDAVASVKQ